MTLPQNPISQHYTRDGLGDAIFAILRSSGKPLDALRPDDLAPVDQFHVRGRDGTLDLARRAGFASTARVLDVGGGMGGPARLLAGEVGCSVEVLDITEEFCRTGEALTAATGQSGRVTFRHGSALDMPYEDGAFDAVWTQHSTMNIEDKPRLYSEIRRVLRPGGRLAMHEILAGARGPIHFPVPWARTPAISFLLTPEAVRTLLEDTGFREISWIDETPLVREWIRSRKAPAPETALGLHLLLGESLTEMFANLARNLEEDRVRVVQAVWERPA